MKVCSTPSPEIPNAILTALSGGYIKIWNYESNSVSISHSGCNFWTQPYNNYNFALTLSR